MSNNTWKERREQEERDWERRREREEEAREQRRRQEERDWAWRREQEEGDWARRREQELQEKKEELLVRAESGDIQARLQIGISFYKGINGYSKDYARAEPFLAGVVGGESYLADIREAKKKCEREYLRHREAAAQGGGAI